MSKLFKVDINITWFLEANCEAEAEQEAIDCFCLEDAPSCCTFDLSTTKLVNAESLKTNNVLVTLSKIQEMIEECDSKKLLKMLLDMTISQECTSNTEITLSALIQDEIKSKLGMK